MTKSTKIYFNRQNLTETELKDLVEPYITPSGMVGYQEVGTQLNGVMVPGVIVESGVFLYAYNLVFTDDTSDTAINDLYDSAFD